MFHIYCVDRENRPITGVTILWPETNKTFVIPRHFSRYGWIVENDHCEIEGAIKKVRDLETTFFVYYENEIPRALSELPANWPGRFSQNGWLGLAS